MKQRNQPSAFVKEIYISKGQMAVWKMKDKKRIKGKYRPKNQTKIYIWKEKSTIIILREIELKFFK